MKQRQYEEPGVKSVSRFYVPVSALVIAMAASRLGCAQTPGAEQNGAGSFVPLQLWKNAVLTGDSAGLKMLYSTNPPAEVTSPAGKGSSDADVDFWMGLKARSVNLEIAESGSPQPDVFVILFQAEVSSGAQSKQQTVYVKERQVWRQQEEQWRLATVERTDALHLKQVFKKDKDLYPANADPRAEINEAEGKAAKEHKRVLLVFGANWCYDCHVLDLAFHRPEFVPVMASYEVVHVDIGPDGKKNADLAQQYGVPLDKGIPALAVLESDGKLIVSQKNGEFENARAMTPEVLLAFLNKWKPPGS
jgi:thioredoxin 1